MRKTVIAPATVLAACFAVSAAAQDGNGQQESSVPTSAPIIVTGNKDEQERVVLGSRIPRKPTIEFEGMATNTGTPGLVPQSGMGPANSIRLMKRSKCVSDDPLVGREAACLLLEADREYSDGDLAGARDKLAYLVFTDDFSAYEQLQGAKRQYRIADEQGDDASREVALEQMIATGAMEEAAELQARRALVAMALRSGDHETARARLLELDGRGALDAQRLANLAVLTRQQKVGDGKDIMDRAIALRETKGRSVPRSWTEFARRSGSD